MCVTGPQHHHGVSRRRFLGATGAAAAAVATGLGTGAFAPPAPAGAAAGPVTAGGLVDLTYPFSEQFPSFPIFTPPQRRKVYHVETNGFYVQQWELWEHQGTHLDAPAHFKAGGRMVTQIGLDELVGLPIAVVDIAARAAGNPDTAVTPADLEGYERAHGRIPDGAAVFMYSAWQPRLARPGAFANGGQDGRLHFPGFGGDAVDWLLAQRNVRGLGVDTLSLDIGRSLESFPAHVKWLGADHWAMECLANLDKLPPSGARLVAAVIPYEEGSGGQCRAFAMLS